MSANETTRRIIITLLAQGRVRRAYLGLVSSPAPLLPALAERFGRREGLRLVDVIARPVELIAGRDPDR